MGNCCSIVEPVPPPVDPSLPTSPVDPVPSPVDSSLRSTTNAIESIGEMYKNIDPNLIDQLISFIETQLRKMETPSEAGSSSSDGWLATVQDATKFAAKTIDIISTEAEKLSKSYAVKEMGSVMINVMKGMGELHWGFIVLSIAAFALESYMGVGSTMNECKDLLLKILELAKYIKQYSKQMPDKREKVWDAVSTIVEGALICLGYLKSGKFSRFWSAKTATEQLEKTNQKLRDVRHSLNSSVNLEILRQTTRRLDQSPLQLLDFQPVGIEEQVGKVKALLDMEGTESALAVIVCGFGGVGKSTLAAHVVQSLDWSSTHFKFCRVIIDEKTPDKTSHIIKLQKDIIYDLGGDKLDLRDSHEGRRRIQETVNNKCSFIFIDNVVDRDYIQNLLPKDFSSGEQKPESEKQKTKLRILVTSRDDVRAEFYINCKLHEVAILSDGASQRLLSDTIVKGKVAEDNDFDEKSMINEVAQACRGVPLLLSVFGKHLRAERNKYSYEEAVEVLRQGKLDSYRDEDLGKTLLFVYDKIKEEDVKEAFLDICTYFHGWEWNLVADIVDPPKLEDLHRRMLVSNSSDKVIVHDILRLMGMEKASLSRFSNLDNLDGFESGKDVKGISVVKGNHLRPIQSKNLEAMCQSLRVLILGDWVTLEGALCQQIFPNLRYLRVGDITTFPFKDPSKLEKLKVLVNRSKPGMNLSHLPSSLKRICHEVPHVECEKFETLPFQKLSSLKNFMVKTSKSVELPEELHLPSSLVDLDLNRCKNLPKDMDHLIALESLILDRSDLEYLPQGFGKLRKLKHLSLNYCSKLAFLSEDLGMLSSLEALSMNGCKYLRALPKSFGGLQSLQTLQFDGCINLHELPESLGELRIQSLNLCSLVNLNELPNSFGNMPLLKNLSLSSCHSLMSLPKSFVQLKLLETLKIIECTKLSLLPEDFGRLRCLKQMTVKRCDLLKELPHDFGALPALKTFTLERCVSFVNLPKGFTELTSLEKLSLSELPLMSSIPDGFGNLKKLRFLKVYHCEQLKTLSDDFEDMATLERLEIMFCPELNGAMMEKIVKLPNCYKAEIEGSKKLIEKWEHMQGETEHPIVILTDFMCDWRDAARAIRVALLNGKCMELNNSRDEVVERLSLLEEGTTATVALIMLPVHRQSHQQQTLQRIVEMARERAERNGSGKLQIVCATKVDFDAERPSTATGEEEEEDSIRQILLWLPLGSCVIPSSQSKRVKLLTECCKWFDYRFRRLKNCSLFMANVGVDMKFTKWDHISVEEDISENNSNSSTSQPQTTQENYNSIQNFIQSICGEQSRSQSECVVGKSRTGEFIEALKGSGIPHLLTDDDKIQVMVDDVHGKAIGLIICNFEFLEGIKLQQIYKHLQQKDSDFIWIWIPTAWPEVCGHGSYTRLIQSMPWVSLPHPQLVYVERIDNPYFVVLDKQGQIANQNAFPLLLGWGVESYPFTQQTIPEKFSSVESESCLEFLLHGMNIVGRKPMRSKITFLLVERTPETLEMLFDLQKSLKMPSHLDERLEMLSKLEELTQIQGNFEVLYVGRFSSRESCSCNLGKLKEDYEDATKNMSWPSLSFSDMIMFWYRCEYLAIKMEPLHRLAKRLNQFKGEQLVLVDNDGQMVTRGGVEVVRMICESSSDGEGMGMVKDELILSLSRGECTSIVKTFFRDKIHNHPQHPQHPIHYLGREGCLYTCDICGGLCSQKSSYCCWECRWFMCGSCWMAYAKQQVEHLVRAREN